MIKNLLSQKIHIKQEGQQSRPIELFGGWDEPHNKYPPGPN